MEPLIFILIVGAVGLINWILKQKQEQQGGGDIFTPPASTPRRSQPPVSRPIAGSESEEERMRKFLDALGIPAETARPQQQQRPAPQPQIQRTPAPSRLPRRAAPMPPPVPAAPAFGGRRQPARPPKVSVPPPVPVRPGIEQENEGPQFDIKDTPPGREAEPIFETVTSKIAAATELPTLPEQLIRGIEPLPAAKTPASQPSAPLNEWLRSPADLRRAIVLREILGQPRALQPFTGGPL